MLYNLGWFISFVLIRLICSVTVKGTENIPKKGGFILASNHLSNVDPFLIGTCITRKLNFMAKKELFENKFVAWLFHGFGAFPVDRDKTDISAIKEALKKLDSGKALLLFPQGTRKENIVETEVQGGVGFLASKSGVPVIPVFISGADKAMPREAKFIKPAKINVRFGKQIFVERRMPYKEVSQQIMDSIRHLS